VSIGSKVLEGVDAEITIHEKGGTSYVFNGRIINYNKTGFDKDVNIESTQGMYQVDKKYISPAEVKFGVILDVDTTNNSLKFEDIIGSPNTGTSGIRQNELSEDHKVYKVRIDFINFNGTYGTLGTNDEAYKEIFYNAYGVSFDKDADSSAYLKGTFTFKASPFNDIGSCNYLEVEKVVGTGSSSYASVENTKDNSMGY
jgi:hypothetical protein